jgi:hypothetical protein
MWKIECPACKKKLLPENPNRENRCRRCGCEIDILFEITAAAANAFSRAQYFLKSGWGDKALEQAQISWDLRQQPETSQLAFLAALFNANYDKAEQWYQLTHNSSNRLND